MNVSLWRSINIEDYTEHLTLKPNIEWRIPTEELWQTVNVMKNDGVPGLGRIMTQIVKYRDSNLMKVLTKLKIYVSENIELQNNRKHHA